MSTERRDVQSFILESHSFCCKESQFSRQLEVSNDQLAFYSTLNLYQLHSQTALTLRLFPFFKNNILL